MTYFANVEEAAESIRSKAGSSEEEKGIGIQTAFSLASLSLLQSFSIEKRKEGLSDPEDDKEQEAFIEQILYVFQKQIQLLEKALGGKE